ncbi:unnamed protein product [Trichogramma brassicae]|uniref:Uncharacterized protein n=1 Tax=Trichogramma brassicae TaxID=86971 RepID=A0A6H5I897_9HYME|nr:unnamed protein product [Trichogramma brassicae]
MPRKQLQQTGVDRRTSGSVRPLCKNNPPQHLYDRGGPRTGDQPSDHRQGPSLRRLPEASQQVPVPRLLVALVKSVAHPASLLQSWRKPRRTSSSHCAPAQRCKNIQDIKHDIMRTICHPVDIPQITHTIQSRAQSRLKFRHGDATPISIKASVTKRQWIHKPVLDHERVVCGSIWCRRLDARDNLIQ